MAPQPPSSRAWLLSYTLFYSLLGIVLLVSLWQGYRRSIFVEEPTRIEAGSADASASQFSGQIDPNIAPWHELSLLPGMGKKVSQEIVAYRQQRLLEWQKAHPDKSPQEAPPVFTKPEDLLPIKGIGPKTLERIRPYLLFPRRQTAIQPAAGIGN